MRLFRVTQPNAVKYLRPVLLQDEDYDTESFLTELEGYLRTVPDQIFILVALDDTDNIKGFIIAAAPLNQKHTFIYQVWVDSSDKDFSKKFKDEMLLAVVLWTKQIGRETVKAETKRNVEALYRRWGFEAVTTIVRFDVEKYLKKLLPEENENGIEQQTENDEQFGPDAATTDCVSVTVSDGTDRTESLQQRIDELALGEADLHAGDSTDVDVE